MKKTIGAAMIAVLAGGAVASENGSSGFSWSPGEGISYNEAPVVTAEVGLGIDSKFMTYGVLDGKDPIFCPSVTATFYDWYYIGASAVFDLTKGNGKRSGWGNRAGKYVLVDAYTGLSHEFDLGESIGTLGVDLGYMYEYAHRYYDAGEKCMDDTQYLTLEMTLDGHWVVPTLYLERDIMADNGTYANLSLAHTFELSETFSLTPSIGQGLGNSLRTKGYFSDTTDGFDHGGLMDTSVKLDLEYAVNDWLVIGAYVGYYDYLLDSRMRDAARAFNGRLGGSEDKSWNFVAGLSLTATF